MNFYYESLIHFGASGAVRVEDKEDIYGFFLLLFLPQVDMQEIQLRKVFQPRW